MRQRSRNRTQWSKIRAVLCIDQTTLANFLGISESSLMMIEANKRKMPHSPAKDYLLNFKFDQELENMPLELDAFSDQERKEFESERTIIEAKFKFAKRDYESKLKDLQQLNRALHLLNSMDFTSFGQDQEIAEMVRNLAIVRIKRLLKRCSPTIMLKLKTRMKTFEVKLQCLEEALNFQS